MNIKHQKDFLAGLLFIGVGVAFACGAATYAIGSSDKMGAGYFPLMLGMVLALLGSVLTFKALVVESDDGGKMGPWAWRPLFFILLANLAFGAFLVGFPEHGIAPMGLIAAIYALTFIAALAGEKFHFFETLLVATVLAVFSYVGFVWLLQLPFLVWPAFVTG